MQMRVCVFFFTMTLPFYGVGWGWRAGQWIGVDGGGILGFSMIKSFYRAIGNWPQTSLTSNSGCTWADALIRLVNILIELKA